MANTSFLSRLMKMSWSIQRNRRGNRSQALKAAWVIMNNEDLIFLLFMKQAKSRRPAKQVPENQISLFNPAIL